MFTSIRRRLEEARALAEASQQAQWRVVYAATQQEAAAAASAAAAQYERAIASLQERARAQSDELAGLRQQHTALLEEVSRHAQQTQRLRQRLVASSFSLRAIKAYRLLLRHLVVRGFVREQVTLLRLRRVVSAIGDALALALPHPAAATGGEEAMALLKPDQQRALAEILGPIVLASPPAAATQALTIAPPTVPKSSYTPSGPGAGAVTGSGSGAGFGSVYVAASSPSSSSAAPPLGGSGLNSGLSNGTGVDTSQVLIRALRLLAATESAAAATEAAAAVAAATASANAKHLGKAGDKPGHVSSPGTHAAGAANAPASAVGGNGFLARLNSPSRPPPPVPVSAADSSPSAHGHSHSQSDRSRSRSRTPAAPSRAPPPVPLPPPHHGAGGSNNHGGHSASNGSSASAAATAAAAAAAAATAPVTVAAGIAAGASTMMVQTELGTWLRAQRTFTRAITAWQRAVVDLEREAALAGGGSRAHYGGGGGKYQYRSASSHASYGGHGISASPGVPAASGTNSAILAGGNNGRALSPLRDGNASSTADISSSVPDAATANSSAAAVAQRVALVRASATLLDSAGDNALVNAARSGAAISASLAAGAFATATAGSAHSNNAAAAAAAAAMTLPARFTLRFRRQGLLSLLDDLPALLSALLTNTLRRDAARALADQALAPFVAAHEARARDLTATVHTLYGDCVIMRKALSMLLDQQLLQNASSMAAKSAAALADSQQQQAPLPVLASVPWTSLGVPAAALNSAAATAAAAAAAATSSRGSGVGAHGSSLGAESGGACLQIPITSGGYANNANSAAATGAGAAATVSVSLPRTAAHLVCDPVVAAAVAALAAGPRNASVNSNSCSGAANNSGNVTARTPADANNGNNSNVDGTPSNAGTLANDSDPAGGANAPGGVGASAPGVMTSEAWHLLSRREAANLAELRRLRAANAALQSQLSRARALQDRVQRQADADAAHNAALGGPAGGAAARPMGQGALLAVMPRPPPCTRPSTATASGGAPYSSMGMRSRPQSGAVATQQQLQQQQRDGVERDSVHGHRNADEPGTESGDHAATGGVVPLHTAPALVSRRPGSSSAAATAAARARAHDAALAALLRKVHAVSAALAHSHSHPLAQSALQQHGAGAADPGAADSAPALPGAPPADWLATAALVVRRAPRVTVTATGTGAVAAGIAPLTMPALVAQLRRTPGLAPAAGRAMVAVPGPLRGDAARVRADEAAAESARAKAKAGANARARTGAAGDSAGDEAVPLPCAVTDAFVFSIPPSDDTDSGSTGDTETEAKDSSGKNGAGAGTSVLLAPCPHCVAPLVLNLGSLPQLANADSNSGNQQPVGDEDEAVLTARIMALMNHNNQQQGQQQQMRPNSNYGPSQEQQQMYHRTTGYALMPQRNIAGGQSSAGSGSGSSSGLPHFMMDRHEGNKRYRSAIPPPQPNASSGSSSSNNTGASGYYYYNGSNTNANGHNTGKGQSGSSSRPATVGRRRPGTSTSTGSGSGAGSGISAPVLVAGDTKANRGQGFMFGKPCSHLEAPFTTLSSTVNNPASPSDDEDENADEGAQTRRSSRKASPSKDYRKISRSPSGNRGSSPSGRTPNKKTTAQRRTLGHSSSPAAPHHTGNNNASSSNAHAATDGSDSSAVAGDSNAALATTTVSQHGTQRSAAGSATSTSRGRPAQRRPVTAHASSSRNDPHAAAGGSAGAGNSGGKNPIARLRPNSGNTTSSTHGGSNAGGGSRSRGGNQNNDTTGDYDNNNDDIGVDDDGEDGSARQSSRRGRAGAAGATGRPTSALPLGRGGVTPLSALTPLRTSSTASNAAAGGHSHDDRASPPPPQSPSALSAVSGETQGWGGSNSSYITDTTATTATTAAGGNPRSASSSTSRPRSAKMKLVRAYWDLNPATPAEVQKQLVPFRAGDVMQVLPPPVDEWTREMMAAYELLHVRHIDGSERYGFIPKAYVRRQKVRDRSAERNPSLGDTAAAQPNAAESPRSQSHSSQAMSSVTRPAFSEAGMSTPPLPGPMGTRPGWGRHARALYDLPASAANAGALSFSAGDHFLLFETMPLGSHDGAEAGQATWIQATNAEGVSGLVPTNYLEVIA